MSEQTAPNEAASFISRHNAAPDGADEDLDKAVAKFGYQHEMPRVARAIVTTAVAVSTISPIFGVFVAASALFPLTGAFTFVIFLATGVITIALALIYSELGSMYPLAGGLYSAALGVLGRFGGFLVFLLYLLQAGIIPPLVALAAGQFLNLLLPQLSVNIWSVLVVVVVYALAALNTRASANLSLTMFGVEVLALVAIIAGGFIDAHRGAAVLVHNLAPTGKGIFGAVGISAVLLGISIAFLGFNGYDAALNLAEDTKGTRRVVGLGAVRAALVAIVLESLAVAAILIGAPSLKGLMTSSDPVSYFGNAIFSSSGFKVIEIAVVVALVNATLAIVLQFSRILYASGRDKIWPGRLSDGLAWVSPRLKTPVIALGVMFIASLLLVIFSNLIATITFNVAALLGIYVLIVISALVSHLRDRHAERPYRMPGWPLLVVVALAGSVAALIKQTGGDLLILGIWIAGGAIYFGVFLRRKRTWGLPVTTAPHLPEKAVTGNREGLRPGEAQPGPEGQADG